MCGKQGEQKPTEWSEEDEKWIDRACMLLNELNDLSHLTLAKIPSNVDEIIAHIKSLRPQQKTEGIRGKSKEIPSNWKPSEEQMKSLNTAYRLGKLGKTDMEVLQSLYNDIKTL